MCLGQAVKVNEQIIPSLLLFVAVLAGFECKERNAPCKGSDEILIRTNNVESAANVAAVLEFSQDGSGVVGRLFVVEDGACGFEQLTAKIIKHSKLHIRDENEAYIACDLLGEHVIVTFPGGCGQVVGIPGSDPAKDDVNICESIRPDAWFRLPEARVPMTAASSPADFEALGSNGAAE